MQFEAATAAGPLRIEQDVTVIVMQLRICLMHNFATMLPIDKEYIFLLWNAIRCKERALNPYSYITPIITS